MTLTYKYITVYEKEEKQVFYELFEAILSFDN